MHDEPKMELICVNQLIVQFLYLFLTNKYNSSQEWHTSDIQAIKYDRNETFVVPVCDTPPL